ncbi:hypothetical protein GmHk_20G058291 [Glycine max]|nr:hypothetical protein GmHk_20G058291 [Glycine max]
MDPPNIENLTIEEKEFYHHMDVQCILEYGPWSFDKHLLILGVIKLGESSGQVPLFTVPF